MLRVTAPAPTLDEFGILRHGDKWVALTHQEQIVMALLLERFDHVVPRAELNAKLWPDRDPAREARTIHVVICRLRKQLVPLGLAVATIRTHGFVLHWAT